MGSGKFPAAHAAWPRPLHGRRRAAGYDLDRLAVASHAAGASAHQMPLGLLMVGGALLDAGHRVHLLDAECHHLSLEAVVEEVRRRRPDVVMTGHAGSTPAHRVCIRMLRGVKQAWPQAVTVYGGVYPSYHAPRHPRGGPRRLFIETKWTELCFHLHPRRLRRIMAEPNPILRWQLIRSTLQCSLVWFGEILEYLFATRFEAAPQPYASSPKTMSIGEQRVPAATGHRLHSLPVLSATSG